MEYTVKMSTRARHIRITVQRTGAVVVTIPSKTSEQTARAFVQAKEQWIQEALQKIKKIRPSYTIPQASQKEFKLHKDKTLELVQERLLHFNMLYRYSWNTITIRNTKSRWGSCSKKGNLSFNYRLLFLPSELCDYVVVHELCHLGTFDHSSQFWKLVERTIPNYKILRKQLKTL